ncbi:MAG: hypothetical protein ABR521_08615 [Gaiellaceae bacterium]
MTPPVDLRKLTRCADFSEPDTEEAQLVDEMIERAHAYLSSFKWCSGIRECYLGDIVIGGVVAVLLFRINPARPDVDEWLWVVVGDLPPAYLVVDDAPNPAAALDVYIGEMERWVDAVKPGDPVDDLIPVEPGGGGDRLEPTAERAAELESRLRFLDAEILAHHAADLGDPNS